MTFSSLISRTVPHHGKYHSRQGRPITQVNQHHWAGIGGGDARLVDPNQQASCTYIIYTSGEIVGQVPEEFRPWTTGTFEADAPAITIEVQNINGQVNGNDSDPKSWQISDAAYASIIRLLADIAERYRWGVIADGNYRGHREYQQTACPGGFLWSRMGKIRSAANALLTGVGDTPATPPTKGKTVWQLADEVMAGLHGNGAERKSSLGKNYNAVQAEINRRSGIVKPKSSSKSTAQLADEVMAGVHGNGPTRKAKLGNRYNAVQAEINRRLGAGRSSSGPNISQLADAVMRGDYGNGQTRINRLGKNYKAVQNEINRRMGL